MKKADVKVGQILTYTTGQLVYQVKVVAVDQERSYWGGPGRRQRRIDSNGVLVQPIMRIVMGRSRYGWIKTASDASDYEPFVVHFRAVHDDWPQFRERYLDRIRMYELAHRRARSKRKRQEAARAELVPLLKKAGIRSPLVSHSSVILTLEQTCKLLAKAKIK